MSTTRHMPEHVCRMAKVPPTRREAATVEREPLHYHSQRIGDIKAMPKKKNAPEYSFTASDENAAHDDQIKELLSLVGERTYEWLLIVQQSIYPYDATIHPTEDALINGIGSALACRASVVAIYNRGRQLSDDEVSLLHSEALNELGPISRARAEGLV